MSQLQSMTLDELYDEFDFLGDWESKCEYLIELGFDLPPFPAEAKTEEHRVHGCQSNVWLVASVRGNGPPTIDILADSDAMIVRGLIAVLLTVYSGRTPREILATDPQEVFSRLGLDRHLSSARKNGLLGMVKRIRTLAAEAA
ncbi:MAG TPA: SufE family protein [Planctomycetaceae bacterium]|nr:SufE family protein [Planctomycetaceae bacterium]